MIIRSRRQAALVLRHAREAAGLSRRDLADRIHVAMRTVAGREIGEKGLAVDDLIQTADALGLRVVLLAATDGEPECCAHCRRVRELLGARRPIRQRMTLGHPFALLYDAVSTALGRREHDRG